MKTLDHSKVYYKGVGQASEEDCSRCLKERYNLCILSLVLLLVDVVSLYLGYVDGSLKIFDYLVAGFSVGTFFWILFSNYLSIQKFRLRLKEIKEGDQ